MNEFNVYGYTCRDDSTIIIYISNSILKLNGYPIHGHNIYPLLKGSVEIRLLLIVSMIPKYKWKINQTQEYLELF